VVSLQPSATQILDCLGLLDRVAACTRHCVLVCAGAAGKLMVEDAWTARAAEITAVKPDLVIAAVPFQAAAVEEILKSGARLLALAPRTLADVYGDIATIANLFQRGGAGDDLIASMQDEIEAVRQRVRSAEKRPLVHYEEWGKPILRGQHWIAELVEAAGGVFLGEPTLETTAEQVAAADPEVIIAAWCGSGDRVPLEKVVTERGWEKLRAVRERHVYCIRDELLTTPAPILIRGLHSLAAAIHPEVFGKAEGLRRIGGRLTPD
jgi:iron complex transport system substrate-binding protein